MDLELRIAGGVFGEIEAQARRDYPAETCGFLGGFWTDGFAQVSKILPAANRHSSDPNRHYLIEPSGYREAENWAVREGVSILGVYHSHPDHPAMPSDEDSEFAFPEWFYWITPVTKEICGAARAWMRSSDGCSWAELRIVVQV